MFFIGIFGITEREIGEFSANRARCSYCERVGTQQLRVFRRYFHFFWIPLFPLGSRGYSECRHCRKVVREDEFDQELQALYEEALQRNG